MKVKRVLLTGDDGYNSIGIRLLIHYLKDTYDLSIAGTKTQQSGVGGKLSLNATLRWSECKVDDVKGVWVDGTPADTIEFAQGYFKNKFDLVISGINLGANVSGSFITSGTIAAACRTIVVGLTEKAIVLSWNLPLKYWFRDHSERDDIKSYLDHPGKTASKIVSLILKNNLWGSQFVNVNFPADKTKKIVFTRPLSNITKFYKYPVTIDNKTGTFIYPQDIVKKKADLQTDAGAIQRGYISVTPCKIDMVDDRVFNRLKANNINLT